MEFRLLKEDEIECRVGNVSSKGYTLLLYKNARADMTILDEIVGCGNWQREHYECKGNLFCKVGININYKQLGEEPYWVWKSDCGSESNTEKEKGEASDSFKRACVNWGIGRELYSSPFIFINCQTKAKSNGYGYELPDSEKNRKFKVNLIDYVGKKISKLIIADAKTGEIVFSIGNNKTKTEKVEIEETKLTCANCGELITEKVASYSKSNFGKELCMKCQKEARNG